MVPYYFVQPAVQNPNIQSYYYTWQRKAVHTLTGEEGFYLFDSYMDELIDWVVASVSNILSTKEKKS